MLLLQASKQSFVDVYGYRCMDHGCVFFQLLMNSNDVYIIHLTVKFIMCHTVGF